jgi:hypothetical protein
MCVCVFMYIFMYMYGWSEVFHTRSDPPWGPPSPIYNEYRVFTAVKAAEAGRWPPTSSSAKVKERVQLHFYSPSGLSWPVLGWTLPLPFTFTCMNGWMDDFMCASMAVCIQACVNAHVICICVCTCVRMYVRVCEYNSYLRISPVQWSCISRLWHFHFQKHKWISSFMWN